MKVFHAAIAAGLLVLALGSGAAHAKAGDPAWAKCVWEKAPGSAAKWLTMKTPKWQTPLDDPASLIGHRLIALCDAAVPNPLKPNRTPSWNALMAAVKRAKPKAPAATDAPGGTEVVLCESRTDPDGTNTVYLREIVRRAGGRERVSFQLYYGEYQGKPVVLPQDLRMIPQPGTRIARSCRAIGAGGVLSDA